MTGTIASILLAGLAILAGPAAVHGADRPLGACAAGSGAFLTARLRGGIEADLDWRGAALECAGMERPDGRGIRLRFAGTLADGTRLAIVFAPPQLAEGRDATAVPVNVTVLDETRGLIFGTLGEGRCTLDQVAQEPAGQAEAGIRLWSVRGRGFCTEPARALDGSGSVLLTRFDFLGQVAWRDDPAVAAAPPAS